MFCFALGTRRLRWPSLSFAKRHTAVNTLMFENCEVAMAFLEFCKAASLSELSILSRHWIRFRASPHRKSASKGLDLQVRDTAWSFPWVPLACAAGWPDVSAENIADVEVRRGSSCFASTTTLPTFPLVFYPFGHNPSHVAKCLTVGRFVMSVPNSLMSVHA